MCEAKTFLRSWLSNNTFKESEVSVPYSQQPAAAPCPTPQASSMHSPSYIFNIIPTIGAAKSAGARRK